MKYKHRDFENYDYGARFYDPQIGIWHTVDPLAEGTPVFSPYHYCYDNPVNYIDPFGLEGTRSDNTKDMYGRDKYDPLTGLYIAPQDRQGGVCATGYGDPECGHWGTEKEYGSYTRTENDPQSSNGVPLVSVVGYTTYRRVFVWDTSSKHRNSKGGGGDVAAACLNFSAAAYWGATINTLYDMHESKNLANNMAMAKAYKSVTGRVPKSMRTLISDGKVMTTVTKAAGRGLFVVGTAMTVYNMATNPTTENLILGSADLVMGVVSIGCPVVGLFYFTGRTIYDITSEE